MNSYTKSLWYACRLFTVAVVCLLLSTVQNTSAQEPKPGEYEVKAAFLFNFAKFIDWPGDAFSDPNAPITFCILGEDPFGSAIDAVKGKTIKGKEVLINRFKDVRDIRVCHILFISSSEKPYLSNILNSISHLSVLTVGDMEKFAQQGGVINFIMVNNKVGFEINVDAAHRGGLKISSKLLNLAKIIHNTPDGKRD